MTVYLIRIQIQPQPFNPNSLSPRFRFYHDRLVLSGFKFGHNRLILTASL